MIKEENFPFAILAEFGLTQEMIDDLPESVLDTIYSGGRSPLLPIEVESKHGTVSSQARFRIVESLETGEYDVMFYPKLREAPLDDIPSDCHERLLNGQPVIANGSFCQLDKKTKHIFSVPLDVIARNIRILDTDFNLSGEDMAIILCGDTVTLNEPYHITLGINILSDTGITIVDGDKDQWQKTVSKSLPRISYGVEGVWINENGALRYIPEEEYEETEIISHYNNISHNHEKRNRDNGADQRWSDDLRRVHQPAR